MRRIHKKMLKKQERWIWLAFVLTLVVMLSWTTYLAMSPPQSIHEPKVFVQQTCNGIEVVDVEWVVYRHVSGDGLLIDFNLTMKITSHYWRMNIDRNITFDNGQTHNWTQETDIPNDYVLGTEFTPRFPPLYRVSDMDEIRIRIHSCS